MGRLLTFPNVSLFRPSLNNASLLGQSALIGLYQRLKSLTYLQI